MQTIKTNILSISRSYYYGYGSVSAGAIEPVSVAEAKAHLRVDFPDDDGYISTLITQCRKRIEHLTAVSIVPVSVVVTLAFQRGSSIYSPVYGTNLGVPYGTAYNAGSGPMIELPYGPVLGITSVTSIGSDNTVSILDPLQFNYYIRGTGFQVIDIENCPWNNAILMYTAGYQAGTVPEDLVLAIKNEIAFRYEARGEGVNRYASQNVGASEAVSELISTYRRMAWL